MAASGKHSGFDERLLLLFRNRAQLKKAHQQLQKDYHLLQEQLKNAEASTRRAEERLEAIERLMAKPQAGYSGLVYFQLRALWRACNDQLKLFAGELRKQQEDRERKKQVQRFNQDRDHRLDELSDLVARVKEEADGLESEARSLEEKHARLSGFWNYFRRREVDARLSAKRDEHSAARKRIDELFDRRIKIEGEPGPDFPGLSVEGRRVVNVAVVALACHLLSYFSEAEVARLAREAVTRPIQDLKYGSEDDCTRLIGTIQRLMLGLKNRHLQAPGLKELAQSIRRHAEFRSEEDTVPVASSIDELISGSPALQGSRINVLTEEYWDIYEVFIR
ncbi:MAG: hypothetical protein JSW21_05955 [Gammaproteobacteria bacterium]|nr:MAG: hypothetical protein JSW21_05955 [Gammaproteobacteria bacterium]